MLARDRAADLAARSRFTEALETLRPLVADDDAALEDLLRAANAQLAIKEADDRVAKARPLVERARALAPDDPRVAWLLYRIAAIDYDLPAAIAVLRGLHARLPGDPTVVLALASALDDLDEPEAEREAQELYRELLAMPAEDTGSWRMTALYRLGQSLIRADRADEGLKLLDEMTELEARGATRPGVPEHEPDTLGAVPPHTPGVLDLPAPEPPTAELRAVELAPAEGLADVLVVQLSPGALRDVGVERGADREELYAFEPRATIVAFGPAGVLAGTLTEPLRPVHAEAVRDLVPLDRMNAGAVKGSDAVKKTGDRDLDLLVDDGGGLRLLENVGGQWSVPEAPRVELGDAAGVALAALDHDHDGDVDVLARPARLLRNDGLDGSGGLTDVTAEAGFPALAGDGWRAIPEDLDRDSDVDVLFVGADGALRLASSLRGGRFEDATASLPAGAPSGTGGTGGAGGTGGKWVVVADFDGDSWTDLARVSDTEVVLHLRTELGGWRGAPLRIPIASAPTGQPLAADWDLDGRADLLWPSAAGPAAGLLAPGAARGGVPFRLGAPFAAPRPDPARIRVADLDADGDHDLVRLDDAGLVAHVAAGSGTGLTLALQGHKDNARGVGAIVELRSGLRYRRIYWRGQPELVGFDGARVDVVRVTWPNGVVQGVFGLAPGEALVVAQRIGLVGSCPFLYTWNGTTYELVSDVLGITPLGLPMAPGLLVPPDHDEYVLVRGEQLVPKDGFLELQLTEELREVTYLDRIRLDVVDHPADVEVFPDERFTFPPFPAPHTHTVRDPLAPRTAKDDTGRDWAEALARDDGELAAPFEPQPGPYSGLATEHVLELAFDPERVRSAEKLRLFLNGWFYWTDASVNLAAAAHPDLEFVPPMLAVPGGPDGGGWREVGPIGFPAGKLKTMVFDVTELADRDDPRFRIRSTLRLYWDSIRLATDADDAPLVTTPLEPASAELWQRGFSRPVRRHGALGLEWFEWDALAEEARWDQHPGMYTRLGDVRELLGAIDDRFVIFGAGDALTVRFDATRLPPLPPGWRRDYLVFLDGWAKDRDPNTVEALFVEPLPFHGMSGYPYGPDERFPDGEVHRAWRREWNTRPATRWIEPLAPRRAAPAPAVD